MLKRIISRGIVDGLVLSVTTTAAMMLTSQRDTGSPYAAVNQICHMIDGDKRTFPEEYAPRETPLGVALNCSAMIAWAMIYQTVFGKTKWPKSIAAGYGLAAMAYVVDYHIVPKRFTPGIEKKLSPLSMLACYAALGKTLAIMAAVHDRAD